MPKDCPHANAQVDHTLEFLTGPRHPSAMGDTTEFIDFINDSVLEAGGCQVQIVRTAEGLGKVCLRPGDKPCAYIASEVAASLPTVSLMPAPDERA